ncbi:hypothetical protein FSARC_6697 [Fusarium sarcochroum]|uniref:Zn(2)-C6 fungal-type domain-containing protein n=1 Tax=Fusarium sarcochroum TaxID=1208366 RepID=A0A8H4TWW9_9HYPO|nr:hypothetical protein FSARC_6697 [Fusarium sarcochroum]
MSNLPRPARSCNECRRRKLRCDAQQPKCSFCQRTNAPCEASPAGKRGPKRGHLNALRNRLTQLEETLQNRYDSEQRLQEHSHESTHILASTDVSQPVPSAEDRVGDGEQDARLPEDFSGPLTIADADFPDLGTALWPDPVLLFPQIDHRTHDELDQLYFDRVHPSFPILHQRRYLAWSKSVIKSPSQTCLQHVMWILASLLSTQSRDLINPLYNRVKQDIEPIVIDTGAFELQNVQAWTLLTVCELMRSMYGQAWTSAGRTFRLIQGLRYHEIDSPRKNPITSEEINDPLRTEEKRRVFWLAYLIDHLFSLRNRWPVTLSEHMASTISEAYGGSGQISSDQEGWLSSSLATRNQALSQRNNLDQLGTLAQILGQLTEVLFCQSLMKSNTDSSDGTPMPEYHQRALSATEEIIRVAKGLTTLHLSMVHPLMFMPLFVTAEFLYENRSLGDGAFSMQLRCLVDLLATTRVELKTIASDFINALADPNQVIFDPSNARALVADNLSVSHDSYPPTQGAEQFLSGWEKAKQFMPHFRMEVVDMIAEVDTSGAGGKVWIFSKVSGAKGGAEKDSVDMISINGEGKVWKTMDVQRITSGENSKCQA